MYPTAEQCQKRIHMIDTQLEAFYRQEQAIAVYMKDLEEEKQFLTWLIMKRCKDEKREDNEKQHSKM
jgi:hypothetical protein